MHLNLTFSWIVAQSETAEGQHRVSVVQHCIEVEQTDLLDVQCHGSTVIASGENAKVRDAELSDTRNEMLNFGVEGLEIN